METTAHAAPLEPGTRLEEFVIERLLDRGRYGYSYLAQDGAQREVLLREFLPHEFAERIDGQVCPRDADDRHGLRFWMRAFVERSAQIARLSHPALPRVLRQFEANGTAYEVSAYAPGRTLEALLDVDGTLPEPVLLRLLRGVCDALEVAHAAGVVHRNLGLQHLWLRDADGSVCVQEFGVLRAPLRLKSRSLLGTAMPPYAAPDDEAPNAPRTPASDLYALGVIAYRALTGVLPPSALERRQGAVPRPLAEAAKVRCSETLVAAVEALLSVAPEQRPRSIADLRALLRGAGPVTSPLAAVAAAAPAPRTAAVAPPVAAPAASAAVPQASPVAAAAKPAGPARLALAGVALTAVAVAAYLFVPKSGGAPAAVVAAAPSPPPAAEPVAAPPVPAAAPSAEDLAALERQRQEAQAALAAEQARVQEAAAAKAREAQLAAKKRAGVVAEKPAATAKPAAATLAPVAATAPPAPSADALAAEARARALEDEVTRLRNEAEARQRASDEAAVKAKAAAAAEAAAQAQRAEADRQRQAQAVALARRNCTLPAMQLSEANNLTYYNALSAPGASRTASGAIRLPPVELNDGTTAIYEITPDSCAHRVR